MRIIQAYIDATGHHYDVWIDETKTIQVQTGTTEDGEPVFESQPDPEFVRHFDWGNDVSQESALFEMRLLCEETAQKAIPRQEIDLSKLDISKAEAPKAPKKTTKTGG